MSTDNSGEQGGTSLCEPHVTALESRFLVWYSWVGTAPPSFAFDKSSIFANRGSAFVADFCIHESSEPPPTVANAAAEEFLLDLRGPFQNAPGTARTPSPLLDKALHSLIYVNVRTGAPQSLCQAPLSGRAGLPLHCGEGALPERGAEH